MEGALVLFRGHGTLLMRVVRAMVMLVATIANITAAAAADVKREHGGQWVPRQILRRRGMPSGW